MLLVLEARKSQLSPTVCVLVVGSVSINTVLCSALPQKGT